MMVGLGGVGGVGGGMDIEEEVVKDGYEVVKRKVDVLNVSIGQSLLSFLSLFL